MSSRTSQLYFFFGAFLIAAATFSMDDATGLEDVHVEIRPDNQVLTYKQDWPLTTRIAYNFLYEDLSEQWQGYIKENNNIMSDEEFNQLASVLVGQRGKKLAIKAGATVLWAGANFGVYAGYDQIGVDFVEAALSAMTIAVDVNFVSWLIR